MVMLYYLRQKLRASPAKGNPANLTLPYFNPTTATAQFIIIIITCLLILPVGVFAEGVGAEESHQPMAASGDGCPPYCSFGAPGTVSSGYQLDITKSGDGIGTVTANTGSISWSSNTGTATFDSGTSVALTAAPDPGSVFTGWSGACSDTGTCTITMDSAKSVTAEFALEQTNRYTLNLSRGWNFVSIPVQPDNTAIETVLNEISVNVRVVWGYDNEKKQWQKYRGQGSSSTGQGSNTLTVMEAGKGYWIYMNEAATLTISTIQPLTIQPLNLYEGWNLIGYTGDADKDINQALSNIDSKWVVIWTWENLPAVTGTVQIGVQWKAKKAAGVTSELMVPELTILQQGKAYWIKMMEEADWSASSGEQPPITITGSVMKGPVSGATVKIFSLNVNGSKGDLRGTATTGTDGNYTVTFMASSAPLLAEASGGSYVNEVSGIAEILSDSDVLTAVLPAGTQQAAITPLTHMAAVRARTMAAEGMPLSLSVAAANTGVAQQYQLMDILGILPVAINDAARMETSSRESRNYGIVLAAITQIAADLNVRPIDLAAAFAKDMEDGTLDSLNYNNSIEVPAIGEPGIQATQNPGLQLLRKTAEAVITLPPGTPIAAVQQAINRLLVSDINLTNLAAKNITATPVTVNPAGGFFISATALPAWRENRRGVAMLTASRPCLWAIPGGSVLPVGMTLDTPAPNAPAIQMTLTWEPPLLASGSTMRLTQPFVVQCTDNTGAVSAIQLTATVVKAPPVVVLIVPPPRVVADQLFNVQVVTADPNAGVPSFYFTSPSFANGSPPLGTVLLTNGHLSGKIKVPGNYAFPVVVVDSIGAESDPPVTVKLVVDPPLECTYTYSDWLACQPDNTQTRTLVSSYPEGCSGTPVLSQSCTYVPPACTYTYSEWAACQSDNTQTRTVVSSSPEGCSGTPALSQSCTYVPPPGAVTLTATPECDGTTSGIWLAWTVPTNADSYDIYRNGTPYKSGLTGAQYTDTLVTAGTTYTYYVKAKNPSGSTTSNSASATAKTCTSSSPFRGSLNGSWSGTCMFDGYPFSVSGTFSMTIDANGVVAGSYSGDAAGSVNGDVDTTGNFSAAGTAGDASWSGRFSIVGGTALSGDGSWSDPDCSGGWSGTGTLTP